MKLVLTKQLLLTTAILLTGTACTNENTEGLLGNPSSPSDGDAATRREVVVTIKNKLTVTPTGTKADPIATTEENKISSLDIYVFGSEAEDGDYTFQERFAYREDPTAVPTGASSIDLTQTDDGKEASVSMKLKKGLFVKLYAIANQTDLVDPAGAIGHGAAVGSGTLMLESDFQKLTLANPGQQGTTVQTVGVPTETQFLTFHSPLLVATTTTDILATPLPMSGANTVPTDLTDFEAFARIQASFKLTRTVARFDVVNDATTCRFTVTNISMGNARKGITFFPIASVGTAPGDLITLPARTFDGTNANAGTTPAAFYSYPSPKDDNGYIILTGTYKMNNTDPEKTVSYQIPFEQEVNGSGSYIEVAPNHRYTIAITKADDYHLDFNLTVADWTDEGDVDGFEPTEPAPVSFSLTVTKNEEWGISETSSSGDSIRIDYSGGTIAFTITDRRSGVAVPEITVTQDSYNNTSDWWEITNIPSAASNLSLKSDNISTYEVTATIKDVSMSQELNIAYVDIKWGKKANETKRFTIFQGESFISYLDTREHSEIDGYTPQSVRLAAHEFNGHIWAPCNCGANSMKKVPTTTYGFLYQWGRKTPLKHGNEANDLYKSETLPASAAESYQGAFKDKFIPGKAENNNSWLPTATTDIEKLWNLGTEEEPIKNTDNDPCPDGWRIPTKKEMATLTGEPQFGSTEDAPAYLPVGQAPIYSVGKRAETGTSAGYHEEGYFWTSLYTSNQANGLFFKDHSGVNINQYNLANAFGIRCIKE